MKAPLGIPDPFCQLGVLEQRICAGRIKGRHSHIHATKSKHPPKTFCPKVDRSSGVDALKGMKGNQMFEKGRASHGQQGGEIPSKDMRNAKFIMPMGLLKKAEVSLKAILPLPFLNLRLHPSQIGRELKGVTITKPQIVIRFTFHQLHPFLFQGRVEVVKGLAKQVG